MKLIFDTIETPLQYLVEEVQGGNGQKHLFIEGIFLQAERVNRNGRIYPMNVLAPAVTKYVSEQVKAGRAVGELGHPEGPTVNLDKVSHRIVSLKWDGDNVVGRALVLNTPMGNVVKGLHEGGVQLGVSSRGMGSLERSRDAMMVKSDYIISTVDIVQDPSAPEAFVNGIMEGVEWVWDNGILKAEHIEKYETEIKHASGKNLIEAQTRVWRDFLSKL